MPFIAVPTTAGTGSEVTRNAVLGVTSATKGVKVSLRSPWLLPRLAVVDPQLTLGPGYYWDHGISKFPLDVGLSLPLNGNKGQQCPG